MRHLREPNEAVYKRVSGVPSCKLCLHQRTWTQVGWQVQKAAQYVRRGMCHLHLLHARNLRRGGGHVLHATPARERVSERSDERNDARARRSLSLELLDGAAFAGERCHKVQADLRCR